MTTATKQRIQRDPAERTQEIIEKETVAGLAYARTASDAALAGLRTTFALQNEALAAGQAVAAATFEASAAFTRQWTEAVRQSQAETAKLAQAGTTLVEKTLDSRA